MLGPSLASSLCSTIAESVLLLQMAMEAMTPHRTMMSRLSSTWATLLAAFLLMPFQQLLHSRFLSQLPPQLPPQLPSLPRHHLGLTAGHHMRTPHGRTVAEPTSAPAEALTARAQAQDHPQKPQGSQNQPMTAARTVHTTMQPMQPGILPRDLGLPGNLETGLVVQSSWMAPRLGVLRRDPVLFLPGTGCKQSHGWWQKKSSSAA